MVGGHTNKSNSKGGREQRSLGTTVLVNAVMIFGFRQVREFIEWQRKFCLFKNSAARWG
jgi:hypothetical protein